VIRREEDPNDVTVFSYVQRDEQPSMWRIGQILEALLNGQDLFADHDRPGVIILQMLSVRPDQTGRGLAAKLIQATENLSRQHQTDPVRGVRARWREVIAGKAFPSSRRAIDPYRSGPYDQKDLLKKTDTEGNGSIATFYKFSPKSCSPLIIYVTQTIYIFCCRQIKPVARCSYFFFKPTKTYYGSNGTYIQ